jgi:hypothetical protein
MRWKLRGAVLLIWAGSAAAAPDDLPREVLLLAHFKERIRQVLAQVPNYTCLETIQRSAMAGHANTFSPLDTVLLEVSTVGDKELLAWPGARQFEDADISSFAGRGLMGSGIFAMHARNVFLRETTTIRYFGDEEMEGRPVARFDFRVPEAWSGYQIQANGASAKVGTSGSFWIDPDSLELMRMEVRADEKPAALGIERTGTLIDYARMRIGDADALLPQDAQLVLRLVSGEVLRNEIQFSHCHEYRTESTIRFDMPNPSPSAAAPAARRVDLPAGLTVSIELETAIDSSTAHVGDLLRGHVTNDVRRKGKAIIIPKGAIVTGRIRGLERLTSSKPGFDLTIELADLEWENTIAEFYGEFLPADSGPVEDSMLNLPSIGGGVPALPPPAAAIGRAVHAAEIPGTGVLHMKGAQFHIHPGLRMNWRTLEPNRRLKKWK